MFPWQQKEVLAQLSKQEYGSKLISVVANKLMNDVAPNGLLYSHRDYCGHGLVYHKDCFLLVEVFDGWPIENKALASWTSKQEFVDFFALQSDYSCSGVEKNTLFSKGDINNQRITRERLEEFLSY